MLTASRSSISGLGDRDQALSWLEQGYRDRDGYYMAVIRIDPVLASLHGDPRFEALAEKIVPASQFGAKTISNERAQLFSELKTAQCLQSCSRVHCGGLGAFSGNCAGSSSF